MGNALRKQLKEKDGSPPIYLDPKAPIEARVKSLLGFMTIDEK